MPTTTRRSAARVFAYVIALAPAAAPAPAGDEPAGESGWLPILRRQAAEYAITTRGEPPGRLELRPEPILRWSQPVRGGDDGAVFLWFAEGRPAAVGTIFTFRTPGDPRCIVHELHSLWPGWLDAARPGQSREWHPEGAGVEFRPVPDAPEPADAEAARLLQMRAIARRFSANSRDHDGRRWDLRLMPRPLARYGGDGPDLIDGALFCYAQGTDPEVFLLVEARRDGGAPGWRYAPARFSDFALALRLDGGAVWEVPASRDYRPAAPYCVFTAEFVDADTPEEYATATVIDVH